MITNKTCSSLVLVLACTVLGSSGCRRSRVAKPADAEKARAALTTVLEAWKDGRRADSLQGERPAVHASDHEWAAGWKLAGYDVVSAQPTGSDLRCTVQLTIQDQRGRSYVRPAHYDVGTHPALTVLRADDIP